MKYFASGFGVGTVLGVMSSFLYDPETNQKVKDDVKAWVIGVKDDSVELATDIQQTKANVATLKAQLPQALRTLSSLEKRIRKYETAIQPNLKNIKKDLTQINQTIEEFK
ncbi:hypothetical protein [Lactobacillus sp. PV034]|uniref:hypothetical protein n=1 Tax=Lactobacillus sp. PV034 TaxID=2594495 RepID=UPI00223F245D|nr:hypothetical protein [Lactobacillus sp. PV034]QNQ80106.1 hypothetical protein FP432_00350 [Lactobacillus sp. PV034]